MNLKYIVYCFLYFGTIYSQCENYNIEECLDEPYCNWEDNLILQNCNSEEEEFACNNVDQCSWDTQTTYYSCSNFGSSEACAEYSDYGCSWEWSWGGWGNHGSDCVGGGFQIDDSTCSGGNYFVDEGNCIEVLPPDCSEMNETECSSDGVCEWVEDIENGNCGNLWGDDCELNPECNWNCDFIDDYMGWCNYSCDGGPYEIDNSYCQEIVMPECSEMEQSNCEDSFGCDWIVDIDVGSCYSLTQNQCIANSECNWSCGFYHGSCAGCCWYECDGGTYQIDNSYCEEIPYTQGDINGDLIINVLDVIQSVNLILYSEYNIIVDMNYDELINVQDIILLINLIL